MSGVALLLRGLGVARSVLGMGGRYRAARAVGLVLALGWFVYAATNYAGAAGAAGLIVPGYAYRYTLGADAYGHGDRHGDPGPGSIRSALHAPSPVHFRALAGDRHALGAARWSRCDEPARPARPILRPEVI